MKEIKYILFVVILLGGCSKSLIHQYTKNEIVMEKINIKHLEDWSNKKNIDKLKNNQEIRYEATGEGGFLLIEQENDIVTTISVSKKDNSIIGIRKHVDDRKNLTEENINYYLNGMLKDRIKRYKPKNIQDSVLGDIRVGYLNDKIEVYDDKGSLLKKLDFNEIYSFKLNDLLDKLYEDNKIKKPYITMIIPNEPVTISDIYFNMMINEYEDINRELPYWGVIYSVSETRKDNCLLFNGKTGELVKEKQYKLGTAIDHRFPTTEEYFESQRKEFEKREFTIDSTDRKK